MKIEHEILFSPYNLAGCEIKNRYTMVAMGTGGMVTKDNIFNERGIEYYVERAKGGVGLIITGTMYVENEIEKVVPGIMPCPTDNRGAFIMSSSEMCERVHAYGTKIFAQLTAGFGRVIKPHLLLSQPISASHCNNYWDEKLICRELTKHEIETIVEKSGDTAKICKDAGYDGIEIHAVHEGYLLDQFAISLFNKRTDEYGGNLKGRLKFACDIVKNIKQKCGQDFPVIMRYSLKSYIKGIRQGGLPNEKFEELGRDIEEGIEAAKILKAAGYDAFDVDAGTYDSWYWSHPPMYFEKGMNIQFGKIVKDNVDIPVIVAGRMEDPDLSVKAIEEKNTDMIGLGRSLLADPNIVNKIKLNKLDLIRPCLSCHEGCMNRLVSSKPMSCTVNPTSGREAIYGLKPTIENKKVIVIGAGVAGMEAARVLKLRGHEVEIYERNSYLGGSLKIAGSPSFKEDDLKLIKWYENILDDLGVTIHYNTEIREENIENYERDILIIATGSTAKTLKLPGLHTMYKAEDILMKQVEVGNKVAIIGGGLVGCELALDLAQKNKKVYILEVMPQILSSSATMPHMNKIMLTDLLKFHGVELIEGIKIEIIEGNTIKYYKDSQKNELTVDTVTYSIGYSSNNKLYKKLQMKNEEVYVLGDAKNVKNIMYAIWDAYELANNL